MTDNEKHSSDIEKERKSTDEIVLSNTSDDLGEINELAIVAEGEERTTWFVWALVTCSTISGLLFGKLVFFTFQVLLA